jgi:hypothetical protein
MAAARTPPRFVPTLTEVVHSGAAPLGSAAGPAPSADLLAQRVLQRVDLLLERRLREAVAGVILEHTEALAPLLRERLDGVVRDVVAEAVADEMRARQR